MKNHQVYKHQTNLAGMFLAFIAFALGPQCIQAGESITENVPAQSMADVNKKNTSGINGAAGMKLHIDTKTGKFVTPSGKVPPVQLPSPALQQLFSTSSKGLVKKPSKVPGGGEFVNLQGRFMSPLILKIAPDGKQSIVHGAPQNYPTEKE